MVSNDDNLPVVFYHKSRSKEQFNIFRHTDIEKNKYNSDYGFYFVQEHAKPNIEHIAEGIEFYVFLRIENPYIFNELGNGCYVDSDSNQHSIITLEKSYCDKIIERGFDSIIIRSGLQYGTYHQYIVFSPNQIKSVNNSGDFSTEIDDIFN